MNVRPDRSGAGGGGWSAAGTYALALALGGLAGCAASGSSVSGGTVVEKRCGEVVGVSSTRADTAVQIRFVNTRAEPVEVFWIDYEGREQGYGSVPANGTRDISTFLTHPWVVRGGAGSCLVAYDSEAAPVRLTVR